MYSELSKPQEPLARLWSDELLTNPTTSSSLGEHRKSQDLTVRRLSPALLKSASPKGAASNSRRFAPPHHIMLGKWPETDAGLLLN